ncbi:uncharacterized protein LOC117662428 [Pantherophis guttatus]|uniref:Uncharacterized protein LOC117662428 n=1 Tax=Pantherophis guttatus TaxID=94885 RepID=A0ABM3ZFE8_PANGU|nr:uncharacterized protein LOC117662428 [Pantherophis guttatus]
MLRIVGRNILKLQAGCRQPSAPERHAALLSPCCGSLSAEPTTGWPCPLPSPPSHSSPDLRSILDFTRLKYRECTVLLLNQVMNILKYSLLVKELQSLLCHSICHLEHHNPREIIGETFELDPKIFLLGILKTEMGKKKKYLAVHITTAARISFAQQWKEKKIPTKEQVIGKIMECAEMNKLTLEINDREDTDYYSVWDKWYGWLEKRKMK